jgi:integration host factor subunit beta
MVGKIMTTRSELVGQLGKKMPHLRSAEVEAAVGCMIECIADALARGERIEIRGFGGFSLHLRAPRLARNPKTGETVQLPAKAVVHFKPGKNMRDRANHPALGD